MDDQQIDNLEIDPKWFVTFLDQQDFISMGKNPRLPHLHYYKSVDGRRDVVIDTSQDLVAGLTVWGWVESMGIEDLWEIIVSACEASNRTPLKAREYPPEFEEIMRDDN